MSDTLGSDAFRFDLETGDRPAQGAPYRSTAQKENARWGYAIGPVVDEARRAISLLGRGALVHQANEAHTVPLVVLRYRGNAAAVVAPGPAGTLRGFGHV